MVNVGLRERCGARQHWQRVIVVSDPPHTRRLNWVWGEVLRPAHMEFLIVPNTSQASETTNLLHRPNEAKFILSKIKKLVYYRFRYANDACAANPECTDQ